MTGIDLVIFPGRLAPCALAELAEHVARPVALGVDVVARRRWLLGLQAELLLESLDRLRMAPRARPGKVLRRGVGWHGIDRQLPALAVLQGAGPHVGLGLGSHEVEQALPVLGRKGVD